jgi:hypothetical protein
MPTDFPLYLTGTSTTASGTTFYSFTAATPTPVSGLSQSVFYTNSLLLICTVLLAIDLVRRIFGKHSLR